MRACLRGTPRTRSQGAGQYFTPRALIRAMVECVRPEPSKLIADPACGTGGFFLAAYDFITNPDNFNLDRQQKLFLKHEAFHGNEIVANTRRLCLMNMFLHNIGEIDSGAPISTNDALVADSGQRFDYVFANPPFGKKSSMSFTNEEGEQETDNLTYNRQDFWATTSNKQLNFVQHIRTMLKTDGRAAVVVPDNVLFEGGAGEDNPQEPAEQHGLAHYSAPAHRRVLQTRGQGQRDLLRQPRSKPGPVDEAGLVLRLPHQHSPHAQKEAHAVRGPVGIRKVLQPTEPASAQGHLGENKAPEGRWRSYSYEELTGRDKTSLDIFWLKDKSLTDLDNLPEPDELAEDIIENLEAGLDSFRQVLAGLGSK